MRLSPASWVGCTSTSIAAILHVNFGTRITKEMGENVRVAREHWLEQKTTEVGPVDVFYHQGAILPCSQRYTAVTAVIGVLE